ncbi:MAG: hypothetical protein CUN55_06130 [Phototrophicales bacterium]|nr:MAG: hypothetical protein CUN55_06130 [Phototrophicales bacterium]
MRGYLHKFAYLQKRTKAMELIISPPKILVRFRTSLIHSLMNVVGLLHVGERLEGLSDWLLQTTARLTPADREILNPLSMLNLLATGIQGYLIDSVPIDSNANTNFAALHEHLIQIDTAALQKVAFQAMQESFERQGILERGASLPHEHSALTAILERAYQHIAERWEPPLYFAISAADMARIFLDASAMHQSLVKALTHVWENFYQEQAMMDMQQHRLAVLYHNQQPHSEDLKLSIRAITGRALPERLQELMPTVQAVDLIPTSHIGAHMTVAMLGRKWWIGFNANLVPAERVQSSFSPELYPFLKALADETRLKIVSLLIEGEFNVGEIADALNLTQSTASRHLNLLAKTDLLHTRRDGTMRYYTLNYEALQELSQRLGHLAHLARSKRGEEKA